MEMKVIRRPRPTRYFTVQGLKHRPSNKKKPSKETQGQSHEHPVDQSPLQSLQLITKNTLAT